MGEVAAEHEGADQVAPEGAEDEEEETRREEAMTGHITRNPNPEPEKPEPEPEKPEPEKPEHNFG